MNKTVLLVVGLVLVLGGGIYFFNQGQMTNSPSAYDVEATITPGGEDFKGSRYLTYSQTNYDNSVGKKRVFYFHAVWCPTCKVANEEFNRSLDKIPEDVVLLKTDYDTEKELKKKYNITYQHTFVLVDDEGNELKKWNGGGIEELISNTK